MTLKKSQFPLKGKVTPVNDADEFKPVQAGSMQYKSSNEAVVTVTPDPENEANFLLNWAGPGKATIVCTADADLSDATSYISGTLEIEIEEVAVDPNMATKLQIDVAI